MMVPIDFLLSGNIMRGIQLRARIPISSTGFFGQKQLDPVLVLKLTKSSEQPWEWRLDEASVDFPGVHFLIKFCLIKKIRC